MKLRMIKIDSMSRAFDYIQGRKVVLEFVKRPAVLDVLDLEKMLRKLVDFIRKSNDL